MGKKGIDYYPRDVGMMRDRKFNRPRQKFGYIVYVIYDALLEMVYGDKGYYLDYDDKAKGEVIWELQEYCRGKYSVDEKTVSDVIEMLAECELFSGDCFKQGIITSRRIQEVYYRITVERKNMTVDENIWLLGMEEMKNISAKSSILDFMQNRKGIGGVPEGCGEIEGEDWTDIDKNREIAGESKVKESKSKYKSKDKSKENNNKVYESKINKNNIFHPVIDNNIINAYKAFFDRSMTKGDKLLIERWLMRYDSELIAQAFKDALNKHKDSMEDVEDMLEMWQVQGVNDFVDYIFSGERK